jgi:hypothetical protein
MSTLQSEVFRDGQVRSLPLTREQLSFFLLQLAEPSFLNIDVDCQPSEYLARFLWPWLL